MKTIIITGTSSGLGKALLEQVQTWNDTHIVCIARRFLPEQERLAAEKGTIRLVKADLSRPDQLPVTADFTEWVGTTEEVIFINNAAIVDPIGAVGVLASDKIIESAHVNTATVMLLTNALFSVPGLTERKVTILNISSGAAKRPITGWAIYCAVKAGNEMFFDTLAAEHTDNPNIVVRNVNPGVMDTQMQGSIRQSDFPTRQRFVDLKQSNQLSSAAEVAARIIHEYLNK